MSDLHAAAGVWREAGFGPFGTKPGTKAPNGWWRQCQGKPAPAEKVAGQLDKGGSLGLVLLPGQECIDIEGRFIDEIGRDTLAERATEFDVLDLLQRVAGGYNESSPSGGIHLLWRCDKATGNQKLAQRPSTEHELAQWKADERAKVEKLPADKRSTRLANIDAKTAEDVPQVLIETRGSGGFVVVAPSTGYITQAGNPGSIVTVTADERDSLLALFRSFDQMPERVKDAPTNSPQFVDAGKGQRPGDDFDERASWDEILTPHGWVNVGIGPRSETRWRRPGKSEGISATTNATGNDTLIVFSTSTDFEISPASYSKFSAYAVLNHNGDYTRAAEDLGQQGYGIRQGNDGYEFNPEQHAEPPSEQNEPKPALKIHRRSDLRNVEPVTPSIEGVFSMPASVVLIGPTEIGKSFLTLSWLLCKATGRDWLGHKVEQCNTLLVFGEGKSGYEKRVAAWEAAWNDGKPVDDSAFQLIEQPPTLNDLNTWRLITEHAFAMNARFVVLDTFSSLAPDADEIKDVPLIMRRLSDLATAINGTALLVHHPGWSDSGRARGAYQFEANADEVLVINAVSEGSPVLQLVRKRVKDGEHGPATFLHRKPFNGSCIIEGTTSSQAGAPMRDRILTVLFNYGDIGATGPQILRELAVEDSGRSGFYKQLSKLKDEGKVRDRQDGRSVRYWLADDD